MGGVQGGKKRNEEVDMRCQNQINVESYHFNKYLSYQVANTLQEKGIFNMWSQGKGFVTSAT